MISVVTAVLNRAEHLEGCLESVAAQRGVAFEHIVIDGGSTDGGVEILRRWSDRLAYWTSEPDGGIADAMNKGLRCARGAWVLFLHADDQLTNERSLAHVAQALARAQTRIVGFPIRYGSERAQRLVLPRGGTPWLRFKTGFLHQGTFVQRAVFDEIGEHDTQFRIAMDYEFFLRAWRHGVGMSTRPSPVPTWMRDTGISSRRDWPSVVKRLQEERRIHTLHAGNGLWNAAYAAYWLLYFPYRRMVSLLQRRQG